MIDALKDLGVILKADVLETFVCALYKHERFSKVSELHWFLSTYHKAQAESLPLANGALDLHISRAHYVSMCWKNSLENIKCLPPVEEFGWSIIENRFFDPLQCKVPPATQANTNLVKCDCKTGCPMNCKCRSNKIGCIELWHCIKSSCRNVYNKIDDDAFDGEDENVE